MKNPLNLTFNKSRPLAAIKLRELAAMTAPRNPVYVFHHIPKCGGSSINEVLNSWFVTFKDYRDGYTLNYPEKIALNSLRSSHCLSGHF